MIVKNYFQIYHIYSGLKICGGVRLKIAFYHGTIPIYQLRVAKFDMIHEHDINLTRFLWV